MVKHWVKTSFNIIVLMENVMENLKFMLNTLHVTGFYKKRERCSVNQMQLEEYIYLLLFHVQF